MQLKQDEEREWQNDELPIEQCYENLIIS